MIARLGPSPNLPIHACRFQARLQGGAQQKMVHPYARITAEGISEIVPVRIDRLTRMGLAHGVRPALRDQLLICLTGLRKKHGIPNPPLGLVSVEWSWNRVVVAAENYRPPGLYERTRIDNEPIEPCELVIELRSGCGVAVGKIDAANGQPINLGF